MVDHVDRWNFRKRRPTTSVIPKIYKGTQRYLIDPLKSLSSSTGKKVNLVKC